MSKIARNIAICSTDRSSSAPIDERFGRCAWFLLWDSDTNQYEAFSNQGAEAAHGAGTGSVQSLMKRDVGLVIAQRVGPKAFEALARSGVKVYSGVSGKTVEAALAAYQQGELHELTAPNN